MKVETLCPLGRPQLEAPFVEFGGRLPDGRTWTSCPCGLVHYSTARSPFLTAFPGRSTR